ncbi:DUF222 domain-containing protein [Allokutzneria albata]|uniref:DUF222 domain-containing protein n=1 Tax=Allokutzneria albata TaxID=211114 RepID=A0A1G9XZ74_ALLAB|nr:DUF222 domain-containing protein [Allokutzneria albata]SDN02088.1 protein of unknown function [Allokutzneria albata]
MNDPRITRELEDAFRGLCAAQARFAESLAKHAERVGKRDAPYFKDEVGAMLAMSIHRANKLLSQAQTVTSRPAVFHALREGKIDMGKALLIVSQVKLLSGEQADLAEAKLLAYAPTRTYVSVRRLARQLVLKLNPEAGQERHAEKSRQRKVEKTNLDDGMCVLRVLLTSVSGALVWDRIDRLARSAAVPGDPRTLDQKRADVALDLLLGKATSAPQGRPDVQVTVPLSTLMGLNDDPGALAGYGPIPASVAREIAAGGTWKRILTDPATGIALDRGRTEYEPSEALKEFVKVRDGICSAIGCNQPASKCVIDHCKPADGTELSASDIKPTCTYHLRMRHESGWECHHLSDGRHFWATPSGRVYESESEPIGDPKPSQGMPSDDPGPHAA